MLSVTRCGAVAAGAGTDRGPAAGRQHAQEEAFQGDRHTAVTARRQSAAARRTPTSEHRRRVPHLHLGQSVSQPLGSI